MLHTPWESLLINSLFPSKSPKRFLILCLTLHKDQYYPHFSKTKTYNLCKLILFQTRTSSLECFHQLTYNCASHRVLPSLAETVQGKHHKNKGLGTRWKGKKKINSMKNLRDWSIKKKKKKITWGHDRYYAFFLFSGSGRDCYNYITFSIIISECYQNETIKWFWNIFHNLLEADKWFFALILNLNKFETVKIFHKSNLSFLSAPVRVEDRIS